MAIEVYFHAFLTKKIISEQIGHILANCANPRSHQRKLSFDSSNTANLRVFQNNRKQAKINIVFHFFPSLGLNKPP